jgi:hypothetical protein
LATIADDSFWIIARREQPQRRVDVHDGVAEMVKMALGRSDLVSDCGASLAKDGGLFRRLLNDNHLGTALFWANMPERAPSSSTPSRLSPADRHQI